MVAEDNGSAEESVADSLTDFLEWQADMARVTAKHEAANQAKLTEYERFLLTPSGSITRIPTESARTRTLYLLLACALVIGFVLGTILGFLL